jgi:cold shock CspA family protein
MPGGTIKKWTDGGWGFIRQDHGPDVFAHAKYFAMGVRPETGLRVEFEIVNDAQTGRFRADNIRAAK